MFITLKPLPERKVHAEVVINRLRRQLAQVPGISLFLQPVQDIRAGERLSKAQFHIALQSATSRNSGKVGAARDKLRESPLLRECHKRPANARPANGRVWTGRRVASGRSLAAIDNTLYDAFGSGSLDDLYGLQPAHVVLEAIRRCNSNRVAGENLRALGERPAVPLSSLARFEPSNTAFR